MTLSHLTGYQIISFSPSSVHVTLIGTLLETYRMFCKNAHPVSFSLLLSTARFLIQLSSPNTVASIVMIARISVEVMAEALEILIILVNNMSTLSLPCRDHISYLLWLN